MSRNGRDNLDLVSPRTTIHTESVDDYLKAILSLSGPAEERVTSSALASHLGIRAASVTGMLQKLAAQKPSFVKYEKHHGVRLTQAGKNRALEVLRHHRLLERFLHDVLHYPWDEVHEEAERLEHFISERMEDRMAAKLGDPETDPHGHPIPERNGAVRIRQEVPLLKWVCGVPAVVSSVSDRDPAALREMERIGLLPGVALLVEPVSEQPRARSLFGQFRQYIRYVIHRFRDGRHPAFLIHATAAGVVGGQR
jgi:DtxR family Mn-dependent transcriptional regulator